MYNLETCHDRDERKRVLLLSSHTNPTGTALHGVLIALILLRGLDGTEGGTGWGEGKRGWGVG